MSPAAPPVALRDDPKALRLWGLVAGLGVRFGYERSFRAGPATLLGGRFLLSLSMGSLGRGSVEAVLGLCRGLSMPPDYLAEAAGMLPSARFVHLGFEAARTACLYKVYLESAAPARPGSGTEASAVSMPAALSPRLLFRGLKWDPEAPSRRAITLYHWHPGLSAEQILGRVASLCGGPGRGRGLVDVVQEVVGLARRRVWGGPLRFLEVTEEGNPRRSFDLNVYPAGLTVADAAPALGRTFRRLAIPESVTDPLLAAIGPRTLGHLAGGVHRDGREFLNVYYGAEGHNG